jgi:hypothetical protein
LLFYVSLGNISSFVLKMFFFFVVSTSIFCFFPLYRVHVSCLGYGGENLHLLSDLRKRIQHGLMNPGSLLCASCVATRCLLCFQMITDDFNRAKRFYSKRSRTRSTSVSFRLGGEAVFCSLPSVGYACHACASQLETIGSNIEIVRKQLRNGESKHSAVGLSTITNEELHTAVNFSFNPALYTIPTTLSVSTPHRKRNTRLESYLVDFVHACLSK